LPWHPERDRELHLDRVDLPKRRHAGKFAQRDRRIIEMTVGESLQEILRAAAGVSKPEARDNAVPC